MVAGAGLEQSTNIPFRLVAKDPATALKDPRNREHPSKLTLAYLGRFEMRDKESADKSLDCIGLFCPEPLFQTREAIDGLNVGDILEVFADDPAAEEDLTRFAKRTGHEIVLVEDKGDYKRFLIRKGR
jgi:tRNA 2-thiouridine synthesizing protein A